MSAPDCYGAVIHRICHATLRKQLLRFDLTDSEFPLRKPTGSVPGKLRQGCENFVTNCCRVEVSATRRLRYQKYPPSICMSIYPANDVNFALGRRALYGFSVSAWEMSP
jgi:hypothetical protein